MFKAIFGKKEDSVIADAARYVEYGRSFAVFEDGSQYINRMGDELERMGYDIVYIDLMMPYHSHCCNISQLLPTDVGSLRKLKNPQVQKPRKLIRIQPAYPFPHRVTGRGRPMTGRLSR